MVEFGTSFGISTIYLADAVRQTGGKVITTELLESKAVESQTKYFKGWFEQLCGNKSWRCNGNAERTFTPN